MPIVGLVPILVANRGDAARASLEGAVVVGLEHAATAKRPAGLAMDRSAAAAAMSQHSFAKQAATFVRADVATEAVALSGNGEETLCVVGLVPERDAKVEDATYTSVEGCDLEFGPLEFPTLGKWQLPEQVDF